MEREMCSYLEWWLNVDPRRCTTLRVVYVAPLSPVSRGALPCGYRLSLTIYYSVRRGLLDGARDVLVLGVAANVDPSTLRDSESRVRQYPYLFSYLRLCFMYYVQRSASHIIRLRLPSQVYSYD